MKKMLISLMVGISMTVMVGCNEKQVDDVIDRIPTIEENATTQRLDDEVYNYILEDFQVFRRFERTESIEELEADITILREHFRNRLNADGMADLYKNVDGLTSDQKEFFKEYYKFCEEMSKFKVKLPADMGDDEGLARVEKAVESQRKKLICIHNYYIQY